MPCQHRSVEGLSAIAVAVVAVAAVAAVAAAAAANAVLLRGFYLESPHQHEPLERWVVGGKEEAGVWVAGLVRTS